MKRIRLSTGNLVSVNNNNKRPLYSLPVSGRHLYATDIMRFISDKNQSVSGSLTRWRLIYLQGKTWNETKRSKHGRPNNDM